jgi:glutamate-1-semialdehyde 2,1-aminomutase
MAALRVARAHTGKDGHIAVEGGYHGVFTEVMWHSELEEWDEEGDPELQPYGEGIPEVTKDLCYPVPLNDANVVEDLLRRYHKHIGAFLIEPIMGNCCSITAEKQYLQDIRELCDRYNVVLIVDEVKTGFRVAKGGVQELFDFRADLCTFAKAVANGYPMSILAGREDIMRQIGDGVVHGGTFTGHSVSLAAANKTLEILDETDALESIRSYGLKLQEGLSRILNEREIVHSFTGAPALMGLFFADKAPSNYREWVNSNYEFYDTLAPFLHEEGILVEPDSREPWFLCEAHTDNCLDDTLERFERAVDTTIQKLSNAA